MINRKTLIRVAILWVVLVIPNALIGDGRDFLWIGDDILFIALILTTLLLIGLSVAVLVRAATSRGAKTS